MTCLKLDLTLASFRRIFYSSTISKSNTFCGLFYNKWQFPWLAIPSIPSAIILAAVHLWIKYFLPERASDSSRSLVTTRTWKHRPLDYAGKQHRKQLFSAVLCCQHTFCWLVLKWSLYSKCRTEKYKAFSNTVLILMNTLRCFLNANNIHKPLVRREEKKTQPKFKPHRSVSYGLSTSV